MKKIAVNQQQWDCIATQLEDAVLKAADSELLAEPNAAECADHVKTVVQNAIARSRRRAPSSLADFLGGKGPGRGMLNKVSSSDIGSSAVFSDEDDPEPLPDDDDSAPH